MRNNILSFIVPVFNAEKYLKECIDSLITFQSEKVEIVLVDDGSTDNSSAICDEYAARYKHIKVIHQKNGGVAHARNVGLQHSSGEYIFFVDNDDMVVTENLGGLLENIERYRPDIIVNRYVILNDKGTRSDGNAFIEATAINRKSTEEVLKYLRTKRINIMAPWEYVVKREIVVSNGLSFNTDQDGVDDSCFSPILFCYCSSFFIGEDNIYVWRQRSNSQGRSHTSHSYILKMMSTIESLNEYRKKSLSASVSGYILFCIFKNAYSLLGPYYSYSSADRLFLDMWYDEQKLLIRSAAGQSGFVHKNLNILFSSFGGILVSYRLAVLKGFIYSYIYGHSSRTDK